jgi:uncharacterized protein (TIGR02145 family)
MDNDNPPKTDDYKNILQIGDYLFLPAAGERIDSNGSLYFRGSNGYYWSSTNGGNAFGRCMDFSSGNQGVNLPSRENGMSVRCIEAE